MPRAEKRRAARGLPRAVAAALALAGACSVHGGSRVAYEAPPRLDERAREILERSRTEGRAGKLLADLLAVAPKRLAGSPGADRAVAWAEQAMRDAGLDRVWREVVTVPRWVRGDLEEVEVVSEPPQRLRATALGGSIATPAAGIEADVVEVRSDDELRALGDRARGRIVFFNRPMDSADRDTFRAYGGAVDQRSHGPVDASKAGGVAALVRSATTRIDDSPHTGSTRYDSEVPRIPAAALSTVAADRLHALLARGPVRLRIRLSCETLDEVESANVLGEIRGSELPEEIVLIGGHLDAWETGDGAHDDGAGCVHVLEAMRLLRACGIRPKRTIRAVMFMNEENGLRGARDYAARHRGELDEHVVSFESDRGGFRPVGFRTNAPEPLFAALASIVGHLAPVGVRPLERGGGGADLTPMEDLGAAVGELLCEPARYFDFHHSENDVLGAVRPDELQLGAAALAFVASAAADLGAEPAL